MTSFYEHTRLELAAVLKSQTRANRLFKKVYQEQSALAADEGWSLNLPAVMQRFDSLDGTRRYVLRLEDGQVIEAVRIPEDGRTTFCVSSQVGCALGCTFCLTGLLGLTRNLTTAEIVGQVVLLAAEQAAERRSERISVVLMGMGEPLQNLNNVLRAIAIWTDHHGLSLALNRITVSTAGLLPGIERLGTERLFPNLSISLTGATDEKRNSLMPINRKYPIREVLTAVRRFPAARQKRVMLEYVLIRGITDSTEDAAALAAHVVGIPLKINLIPFNPSTEMPYEKPALEDVLRFQKSLMQSGVTTFIRKNRGSDVSGACGQLMRKGDIRS